MPRRAKLMETRRIYPVATCTGCFAVTWRGRPGKRESPRPGDRRGSATRKLTPEEFTLERAERAGLSTSQAGLKAGSRATPSGHNEG